MESVRLWNFKILKNMTGRELGERKARVWGTSERNKKKPPRIVVFIRCIYLADLQEDAGKRESS